MATILKEVDAVVIGVGWTGSIMARELTKAGLNVVGLERGPKRSPREDFTLPNVRDDLKYAVRQDRQCRPHTGLNRRGGRVQIAPDR